MSPKMAANYFVKPKYVLWSKFYRTCAMWNKKTQVLLEYVTAMSNVQTWNMEDYTYATYSFLRLLRST